MLYNVVLISAAKQPESAGSICIFPSLPPSLPSLQKTENFTQLNGPSRSQRDGPNGLAKPLSPPVWEGQGRAGVEGQLHLPGGERRPHLHPNPLHAEGL